MKNISVIGSGTMGNGIAQTFALFNFNVKLYDASNDNMDNYITIQTDTLKVTTDPQILIFKNR